MKNFQTSIFLLFLVLLSNEVIGQPNSIFRGGIGTGYSSVIDMSTNVNLYRGGNSSGYTLGIIIGQNLNLYLGGNNTGYTSFAIIQDFIWTGAVGQGWTVPGNWNLNAIPTITRRTIIPSGVPAYPHINTGLLSIGDNPNNGAYKTKELIILPGALLVTRVNCKVENYGLINIEGTMKIRNTSSDAFINGIGGKINVLPNGLFLFQ